LRAQIAETQEKGKVSQSQLEAKLTKKIAEQDEQGEKLMRQI